MEATYHQSGMALDYTPASAITGGQVIQIADGRAAVAPEAIAAGVKGAVQVDGVYKFTKAADVVIIDGAPIWWDHSANAATPVPQFADRDFYLGCAVGDVAASASVLAVDLNERPRYVIDLNGDLQGGGGGDTAIVLTAGTPSVVNRGGMLELAFSATNEAQKVDWMSRRSVPVSSNWVLEAMIEIVTPADADVDDLTVGVANGTHASDFQSVTEFAAFHLDTGADFAIDAESDDGVDDVAPTDTTKVWAAGTPVHLVLDGRDHTDVKYYVNGIEVLSGTANLGKLTGATGPLRAIIHFEKSANDSPGIVQCDMLRLRIAEQ